jgi:hypothetical protein
MDVTMLATVQNQVESYWNFVAVGYGAATVAFASYAVLLVRRGRKLSRQVPPDRRRWL